MTQRLIPFLCVFHMLAILWWAMPRNFESLKYDKDYDPTPLFAWEESLLNFGKLNPNSRLSSLLNGYINVTGSEQYWDFFAPATPKFHQYISICDEVFKNQLQGKISCTSAPLFTNFNLEFKGFNFFGSNDSRYYRLTENLTALDDPKLFQAFTHYYQAQRLTNKDAHPVMILHLFELAPGLEGLPSYGYQMDNLLFSESE